MIELSLGQRRTLRSDFQSGVSAATIRAAGRQLGADYLISGTLTLSGIEGKFTLNVHNTTTAQLQSNHVETLDFSNDQHFENLLGRTTQQREQRSSRRSSENENQTDSIIADSAKSIKLGGTIISLFGYEIDFGNDFAPDLNILFIGEKGLTISAGNIGFGYVYHNNFYFGGLFTPFRFMDEEMKMKTGYGFTAVTGYDFGNFVLGCSASYYSHSNYPNSGLKVFLGAGVSIKQKAAPYLQDASVSTPVSDFADSQ